jgi:hypothetical protein
VPRTTVTSCAVSTMSPALVVVGAFTVAVVVALAVAPALSVTVSRMVYVPACA